MRAELGDKVKIYDGREGTIVSIIGEGANRIYYVHGDDFYIGTKGDRLFGLEDKLLFEVEDDEADTVARDEETASQNKPDGDGS